MGCWAVVALSGCGSAAQSDAKSLFDLQCRAQKLAATSASDPSVLRESMKLAAEAQQIAQKLEAKYSSASQKEELRQALVKYEQDGCK
jgi:hypothetical protein